MGRGGYWTPPRPKLTRGPWDHKEWPLIISSPRWPGPIERVQDHKSLTFPNIAGKILGDGLGPKLRAIAGFWARFIDEIFRIGVLYSDALNFSAAQFLSHEFQTD
ncbi:hypothetical protein O181_031872 [Austropuccinia psidii MF-1]|uniref:Uncharacterized protein n=1 Tax=Austropuccinia psidii MF-1 TaxID=1389203 RepID=A0A9Q3CYG3_9BASI|nr:hypothetical protein [Austropuccinia psidii MF-1]